MTHMSNCFQSTESTTTLTSALLNQDNVTGAASKIQAKQGIYKRSLHYSVVFPFY